MAGKMQDPKALLDAAIKLKLAAVLKNEGFLKSGRRFRRRVEDVVHILELDANYHPEKTISVSIFAGVHVPLFSSVRHQKPLNPFPTRPYEHVRKGVRPESGDEAERYMRYPPSITPEELSDRLFDAWKTNGRTWLDTMKTTHAVVDELVRREDHFQAGFAYYALNDRDRATDHFNREIAKCEGINDRRVHYVRESTKRFGLAITPESDGPKWGIEGEHWYTEKAWAICEYPNHLIGILERMSACDSRKARLAAVAILRHRTQSMTDAYSRALSLTERYADGVITHADYLKSAIVFEYNEELNRPYECLFHRQAALSLYSLLPYTYISGGPLFLGADSMLIESRRSLTRQPMAILRDIFPNPFRPPSIESSVRNQAVMELGKSIYEGRTYELLPVLGDLVEEAGCDGRDILDHLRSDGPHYRGCWALDVVLGKDKVAKPKHKERSK